MNPLTLPAVSRNRYPASRREAVWKPGQTFAQLQEGKSHNNANYFYPSLSILFCRLTRYHVPPLQSQLASLLCLWQMCCIFIQIRPGEGGYGFTLEEKNRVPIIKFVEKGSPAEVGMCIYTHTHTDTVEMQLIGLTQYSHPTEFSRSHYEGFAAAAAASVKTCKSSQAQQCSRMKSLLGIPQCNIVACSKSN